VVRRVLLLPPLLLPLLLLLLHPLLLILQLTQVLPLFGAQALLEALEGPKLKWKAVADLVEGYGELLPWQLFAPVIALQCNCNNTMALTGKLCFITQAHCGYLQDALQSMAEARKTVRG
jgi:hypothetical protein